MRKIFLSVITLTVLSTACKKEDPVETNTNTNSNSSNPVDNIELVNELKSYAPLAQIQTKNSDNVITFTTEKGNELIFPAKAFVDGSGNPVTGNIDVSVTEITNISEMILSGMMTNSDQGPLSSQGEFKVEVSQNDQPLKLAEGSTFTIENKNTDVDKDMKGWIWKENQTVGEAVENNIGEWVRNEFDENNPCKRMQSLWAEFESNTSDEHSSLWKDIKPLKDLVFKEINKISPLNDELFRVIIYKDRFENPFVETEKNLSVYNSSDVWSFYEEGDTLTWNNNWLSTVGNGPNYNSDSYIELESPVRYEVDMSSCMLLQRLNGPNSLQSYSFDPNVINITFSQLSWCNIDKLLWEYGQINSCKLKGNFPDNAQVKIIFKDLNGAISCDFSDDGFVASRLPESYDLMFLVYYKDGESIKFGTQTITAAEEMTFDDENIKTLNNIDALVDEIEKLVD